MDADLGKRVSLMRIPVTHKGFYHVQSLSYLSSICLSSTDKEKLNGDNRSFERIE